MFIEYSENITVLCISSYSLEHSPYGTVKPCVVLLFGGLWELAAIEHILCKLSFYDCGNLPDLEHQAENNFEILLSFGSKLEQISGLVNSSFLCYLSSCFLRGLVIQPGKCCKITGNLFRRESCKSPWITVVAIAELDLRCIFNPRVFVLQMCRPRPAVPKKLKCFLLLQISLWKCDRVCALRWSRNFCASLQLCYVWDRHLLCKKHQPLWLKETGVAMPQTRGQAHAIALPRVLS